jgi:hypothetical protein
MGQQLLWWTPGTAPARGGAGRRRAAVLLVLSVLGLHAWLVAGLWLAPLPPASPGRGGALRVRVLALPPARPVQAPAPLEAPATGDATPPATKPVDEPPARAGQGPRAPSVATAARRAAASTPLPASAASGSAVAQSPAAAGSAPPLYPTRLPPAGSWPYTLQRNGRSAPARLQWQHDGARYTAQLDADDAQLQWHSRGALDDAGLQPERFVDRRDRRRDAANFEREGGRIGYSGNAADQPAWRGSQDRLSLLLQLAAILDARRAPPAAGEVFLLHVSGARGDAALWRLEVQGPERITLADGSQRFALKLLREPTGPYDTRAELWTDPGNHHLPLRARFSNGAHVLELSAAASPDAP